MMDTQVRDPRSAVVIGAGVSGLATAALLARRGVSVTIVDKLDHVGGRAGSLEFPDAPGFRWDAGPSWYLMPEAFDHFFELCGTSTEEELELVDLTPAYRIYDESQNLVEVETGREKVVALFESIEPGAGAKVREYLDTATKLYFLSLDLYLYTTFASIPAFFRPEMLKSYGILLTMLSKNLGSYVERTFKDPQLRQILNYPAVFLSSQPAKIPAMYSLMSHTDLVEGVRYPLGGFDAVVRAIAKQATDAGVNIVLGAQATAIITSDEKKPRALGVRVMTDQGSQEYYGDIVVSAADLHHTENNLLPAKLRTYPERRWARRDPGISTVLLLLGVKGEIPELSHHTLLLSREWDADFRAVFDGGDPDRPLGYSQSLYISKPSATDPAVAPEGYENLFVLVPIAPDPAIGHGDTYGTPASDQIKTIADAVIAQIGEWAGIKDFRERIVAQHTIGPADFSERYNAWRGGSIGPAHTLAQSAILRGSNASKKVSGLYYAGCTTIPGVGVPMCLISAENVIKQLDGDTSFTPLETI